MKLRARALAPLLALLPVACGQILGLGDFTEEAAGQGGAPTTASSSSAGGGSTTSSTTTTSASSSGPSGAGGGTCTPDTTKVCYDGPSGTSGRGICVSGQSTCQPDGSYGTCDGEVVPMAEACASSADEDCDGQECVEWARVYGDVQDQRVSGIAVDADGNVVIAGTFSGTLAFDPAAPLGASGTQIYVAKFDHSGAPLWSLAFASNGVVGVSGVAVDGTRNVVVTGTLQSGRQLNFGGTPFSASANGAGAWIVEFDAMGGFKWNDEFEFASGDQSSFTTVAAPAIDTNGSVFAAGDGRGNSPDALYVRKYSPGGALAWSNVYQDSSGTLNNGAVASCVATTPFGDVVLGGYLYGSIALGGQSAVAVGKQDAFVVAYDSSGGFEFLSHGGAAGQQATVAALGSDASGNVTAFGAFGGSLQWGATSALTGGPSTIFLVHLVGEQAAASEVVPFGADTPSSLSLFPDQALQGPRRDERRGVSVLMGDQVEPRRQFIEQNHQRLARHGSAAVTATSSGNLVLASLDASGALRWSRTFGAAAGFVAPTSTHESWVSATASATSLDLGGGSLHTAGGTDVLLARFAP